MKQYRTQILGIESTVADSRPGTWRGIDALSVSDAIARRFMAARTGALARLVQRRGPRLLVYVAMHETPTGNDGRPLIVHALMLDFSAKEPQP